MNTRSDWPAGRQPAVEEYAGRYPQLAAVLRLTLPALEVVRPSVSEDPPKRAEETAGDVAPEAAGRLGDYRIIREIGRGGMGIVYEAEQISLGRRVALKVLPFAAVMDPKQLQRFKNEAQAAAQLHHTNIVPVFGVGCERGVHFYAMQYIEGQTVAAVIAELRQQAGLDSGALNPPLSEVANELGSGRLAPPDRAVSNGPPTTAYVTPVPAPVAAGAATATAGLSTQRSVKSAAYFRTVANLGLQAAEGLEHAHELGVVHRDIKPANLLVDMRGNVWITDFGLAHFQNNPGLTLSGDLVGTLRYMSPEQALAKRVLIDQRTDLYSLGVTLYELLTLEPAFGGKDRQELLRQIAFEEPRPPRRLNKPIPAELETIVLKAIEKNPAERYATAQELADDLRRFLEDKPIRAKRPTLVPINEKQAKDRPGEAAIRLDWALSLTRLSELHRETARFQEAEKELRQALAILEKLPSESSKDRVYLRSLADALSAQAKLCRDRDGLAQARRLFSEALARQKTALELSEKSPGYQGLVAIHSLELADTLLQLSQAAELKDEVEQLLRESVRYSANDRSAQNALAWFLATCRQQQFRDPKRALELAKRLVEQAPQKGAYWRTLGAALYGMEDWKGTVAAMEKAMELRNGGDGTEQFFIAMAYWRVGNKEQARASYEQAVQWMAKHKPQHYELRRFRAQAAALLGIQELRPHQAIAH